MKLRPRVVLVGINVLPKNDNYPVCVSVCECEVK